MNRITYTNSRKTEKQQEDTKKALLNTNFRKALKYGLDRVAYLSTYMDPSANLGQGQDSIYNPEKAAAAIDKSQEEMPEVE